MIKLSYTIIHKMGAESSSMRRSIAINEINQQYNRDLYFWNKREHSFLGGGITNPSMKKNVGEYNKWRIELLDGRAEVTDEGRTISVRVAIRHVASGKYLSCRRWCFLTNSALAEFRTERDEFESFTMIYAADDNSYIFKSHNDLFLSVNEKFYTGAFKSCRDRDRDENGRPFKGRWELLDCDTEITRKGTKDTTLEILRSIPIPSPSMFF
jgi:hypothetical protein